MLPNDADKRAEGFERMSPERKREVLDHVRGSSDPRGAINAIVSNGGEEAEFVRHVVGKEQPSQGSSPRNKKTSPPQTK